MVISGRNEKFGGKCQVWRRGKQGDGAEKQVVSL
jgi:hypothetical protein